MHAAALGPNVHQEDRTCKECRFTITHADFAEQQVFRHMEVSYPGPMRSDASSYHAEPAGPVATIRSGTVRAGLSSGVAQDRASPLGQPRLPHLPYIRNVPYTHRLVLWEVRLQRGLEGACHLGRGTGYDLRRKTTSG